MANILIVTPDSCGCGEDNPLFPNQSIGNPQAVKSAENNAKKRIQTAFRMSLIVLPVKVPVQPYEIDTDEQEQKPHEI